MNIIADVFKRTKAIPSKLKAYGFVVDKGKLVYVKTKFPILQLTFG